MSTEWNMKYDSWSRGPALKGIWLSTETIFLETIEIVRNIITIINTIIV